ncbi:MAG: hypothetical protein B7Z73_03955 [Planctomycetia bacterium 21-64-5]|nr:MAG: hypothetical protein B7Z73_03955 [Planctomycetia bacterium 21-64-5]
MLGYFAGALGNTGNRSPRRQRWARLAWTLGCLCYLAHVACAFHFYHGWSHAAAYRHTAERTAAVAGWSWGGGVYFNYVFTAVWLADTLWWWRTSSVGNALCGVPKRCQRELHGTPQRAFPTDPSRRDWLHLAVQLFMAFMVFNATVVFGQGFVRWFGVTGCTLLALHWLSPRGRAAW